MDFIAETWHGETEETAKRSRKNYSGLQGFELRGKVEKVRRLNRSL